MSPKEQDPNNGNISFTEARVWEIEIKTTYLEKKLKPSIHIYKCIYLITHIKYIQSDKFHAWLDKTTIPAD